MTTTLMKITHQMSNEFGSIRNRMIWLLVVEITRLHDSVFRFEEQNNMDEYLRLKRYFLNKINCD